MTGAPFSRRPNLRLVPPPRPRHIDVRISAAYGRSPIGRSRLLKLRESALAALIAEAERLEAQG
jgi:hypothetical protein